MGTLRINRRKFAWIMTACIGIAALGWLTYEYNRDMILVRLKLLEISKIERIELHGFDRGDHYHVAAVGFAIAGKPGSAILVNVYDTDQGLTGDPDHLYLSQLGPWAFNSGAGSVGDETMTTDEALESLYMAGWIDVGPKGEFGAILPVKIRNINDLIAHYDQLLPYFASWPDEQHKRVLILSSGKRVGYYRDQRSRYPRY